MRRTAHHGRRRPRAAHPGWLEAEATESEHLHAVILALQPPPLEAVVVGTRVNDVRNEGPELLTPGTHV